MVLEGQETMDVSLTIIPLLVLLAYNVIVLRYASVCSVQFNSIQLNIYLYGQLYAVA